MDDHWRSEKCAEGLWWPAFARHGPAALLWNTSTGSLFPLPWFACLRCRAARAQASGRPHVCAAARPTPGSASGSGASAAQGDQGAGKGAAPPIDAGVVTPHQTGVNQIGGTPIKAPDARHNQPDARQREADSAPPEPWAPRACCQPCLCPVAAKQQRHLLPACRACPPACNAAPRST